MINTIIACDSTDVTLGDFFLACATHAKSIFDKIPIMVLEIHSQHLNEINIGLKVSSLNHQNFIFAAYSHGGEDCLVVGATDPYVSNVLNHTIFNNGFIYTFSCSSGKTLGALLVNQGAKLFIGYNKVIYVILSEVAIFVECANEGLRILAFGGSVGEALAGMTEKYNYYIDALYFKDFFTASTLMENRDALVAHTGEGVDRDLLTF